MNSSQLKIYLFITLAACSFVFQAAGSTNANIMMNSYTFVDQSGSCDEATACMSISVDNEIADIIGFDLTVKYDALNFIPTGNIAFINGLPDNSFAGFDVNILPPVGSQGTMFVSIFLIAGAPADFDWSAAANTELFCIEFAKTAVFTLNQISQFNLDQVVESYISGFEIITANTPGDFISVSDTEFDGSVNFWHGFEAIQYNNQIPNQYAITYIIGVDQNCNVQGGSPGLPDLFGFFEHDAQNGEYLRFFRDISNSQSVLPVINAFDAVQALNVTLNYPEPVPTKYQLIAMDVNQDGAVTSGDISQINQRTVLAIDEFNQISGDNLDWIFIDRTTADNDPRFEVSDNYPFPGTNDGYHKLKVPQVPSCLRLPEQTDCQFPYELYVGILLGDVDGNWKDIDVDGELKAQKSDIGKLIIDYDAATFNDQGWELPVFIESKQDIYSLDFELDLSTSGLKYRSYDLEFGMSFHAFNYSKNDDILRGSMGHNEAIPSSYLFSLIFDEKISDIHKITDHAMVLLNGKPAELKLNNSHSDSTKDK